MENYKKTEKSRNTETGTELLLFCGNKKMLVAASTGIVLLRINWILYIMK